MSDHFGQMPHTVGVGLKDMMAGSELLSHQLRGGQLIIKFAVGKTDAERLDRPLTVLESIPPLRNTPIGTSLTSRILTASSTSERTPSIASDSESLRGELAALSGLQKVAARCFSDPSACT